jgi:hypothetical protein
VHATAVTLCVDWGLRPVLPTDLNTNAEADA